MLTEKSYNGVMNEVEVYINSVALPEKKEMERIRELVKEVASDGVEGMSYGMPGFKYKGKYLIGYATYKDHMSVFPTPWPIEMLKDKLVGYKLAKGTVQFTLENPLPDALIRELVTLRMSEIDA